MRDLLDSIRHQGHVAESPHAGSHSWTRQRSHFSDEAFFQSPYGGELSLTGFLEDAEGASSAGASFLDDDGWEACGSCGAYTAETEEDGNSTDTESDFEMVSTPGSEEELLNYLGSFDGVSLAQLREEYFLAKHRFRYASGKRSTQTRFPRRAPWAREGKGKGRRGWKAGGGKGFRSHSGGVPPTYSLKGASPLGPGAFAGGK